MTDAFEVRATFAPGDVVEGKYRIRRLLAEGGMGAVYHAVQEPLGRDVAVKVLKPAADTPAKREQRYKRFFREAAVSSKLNHPNTIMILDYGELREIGGFFLVMEFLEGESLRELLQQRGALGTRLTLHIAMQVASSLADAHRNGAVHRDLKPPNVMLVRRGDDPYFVKVVDFGLVKQLDPEEGDEELTAENALVGSPTYMAPERFLSTNADFPAVDVYALGIMMYEMLVGRPPFIRGTDSTLHHIMMQHIQSEPPPMHALRPDLQLPDGLEELVMKCLAKNPQNRIGSMDALLRLLRSCAESMGMGVAAPVEDTGAYVPLSRAALEYGSRSEDFIPNDTDETKRTVEDSARTAAAAAKMAAAPAGQPAGAQEHKRSPFVAVVAGGAVLLTLVIVGLALWGGTGATTEVKVTSVPTGASVMMNGTSIGTTPFDGPVKLKPNSVLHIRKIGFADYDYTVKPDHGAQVDVDATLTPLADDSANNAKASETNGQTARSTGQTAAGAAEKAAAVKTEPAKTKAAASTKTDKHSTSKTHHRHHSKSKSKSNLDIKLAR